jgi:hypothetical protein
VLADYPVPNWAFTGLPAQVLRAMVPTRTPAGRPVRTHQTPVRTAGEAISLVARGQVILPTVAGQPLGDNRITLVPIHDLPPAPLGLIWHTVREDARIRSLARTARSAELHR